jgi:hypothetical protein
MAKQNTPRSYNITLQLKKGYQIPRKYADAICLDKRNGNNNWQEPTDLELQPINEYEPFIEYGHHTSAKDPASFIGRFGYTMSSISKTRADTKHG